MFKLDHAFSSIFRGRKATKYSLTLKLKRPGNWLEEGVQIFVQHTQFGLPFWCHWKNPPKHRKAEFHHPLSATLHMLNLITPWYRTYTLIK